MSQVHGTQRLLEVRQTRKSSWLDNVKGTFRRRSSRSPLPQDPSPASVPASVPAKLPVSNQDDGRGSDATSQEALARASLKESAYVQSMRKLSLKEQETLKDTANIGQIVNILKSARDRQLSDSKYERTRLALAPWLQPVAKAFGLAGEFLSAEPVAATASSLIQGTIGFVITFYEIANKLDDNLEHFCRLAPVLTKYDGMTAQSNPAMRELLEQLFDAMLKFHLDIMKHESSLRLYVKEVFTTTMSSTISSFNAILESLETALSLDTNMIVHKLSERQDDEEAASLMQELLTGEEPEILFRNDLEDREDKACEWILQTPGYQRWRSVTSVKYLALIDSSGFGKSVSASYLAGYLQQTGELVCSYHLNQSISVPENVYRGLLYQVLTTCSSLHPHYRDWREHKLKNKTFRAYSKKDLREFLVKCLSMTNRTPYLILDGFDECLPPCQRELNQLFTELHTTNAPIKLFLSASSSTFTHFLPSASGTEIAMDKSKGKDLLIATYWVQRCLIGTEPVLQARVATYLGEQARGSGLWTKLAAEYLNRFRVYSTSNFQDAIMLLPSSEEVVKMYKELFERITGNIHANREQLQRGLELLAVAGRPLTITELDYAVQLSLKSTSCSIATTTDLAKIDNKTKLSEILGPFVTKTQGNRLQLCHASLKNLLLQAIPDDWGSPNQQSEDTGINQIREETLNCHMYAACAKYILLQRQQDQGLHLYDPFVDMAIDFTDEDVPESLPPATASPEDVSTQDPSDCFFSYSAKYWTMHLSHLSKAEDVSCSDLIDLCQRDSPITGKWHGEYENSWSTGYFPYGVDSLQVVARFGSPEVVLQVSSLYSSAMDLVSNSLSDMITTLMDRNMTRTILALFESKSQIGQSLRQVWILNTISHSWPKDNVDKPCSKDCDWNMILDVLIQHLHQDLLIEANGVLRTAAQQGCLPIVQKLFEAAQDDARLLTALLQQPQRPRHAYIYEHQSVGEAVYYGHKNTVRFLCNQKDIEPHIQHINHYGRTVFHQAERCADFETLSIVYDKWPEGITKLDSNKDSLLHLLCFNAGNSSCPSLLQDLIANELLACGIKGSDGETPLAVAVRGANLLLCRFLVDHGADIEEVVEVDQHGSFKPRVPSGGAQKILDGLGQLYLDKKHAAVVSAG